ncbi:MAG TPA: isoprenoid biosynthesis glyoxalase ElbB [Gemmatales bacterium]|mgnify:CR=1 FL=1|nr:isoprenoid biosynthesis glyoxalase ElbB [Gemmatales bacterium]
MSRVAVILSGCGVFDGSEIHETVITLLALARHQQPYQCLAPNKEFDVVDHLTHKPTGEKRNVLVESARIARGEVADLAQAQAADFSAVILPGGFGAAKNLCNYALAQAECTVDPAVARFLNDMHATGKPIGVICIAPVVLARLLGPTAHPQLTIGTDAGTAQHVEQMGAKHVACGVDGIVVDGKWKVVSTPAYMLADNIAAATTGIEKLVAEVVRMVR